MEFGFRVVVFKALGKDDLFNTVDHLDFHNPLLLSVSVLVNLILFSFLSKHKKGIVAELNAPVYEGCKWTVNLVVSVLFVVTRGFD